MKNKTRKIRLINAPVGVFEYNGELVLKTKYMSTIDDVDIPDCFILSTGERFWGGMKSREDFKTKFNNLLVEVQHVIMTSKGGQNLWRE